ncbi:hypothetical protein TAM4_1461 [Thermococcus sp. AM4]|nr:hypothetical protein [Thermococcus sp. AM4]EEB73711.1 hypothetical protein TAM4_1461 [Thermococcus sp. AM4]
MRKLLAILGFLFVSFLLLFAYSYFNQPHETMNSLYRKIPEEVRENSQLIAAYYSSQNGDREYQFAFYNPNDRTLSIYTFKISKLLKIWPRTTEDKISCKTPFNYSILATSQEKLKNFTNCNNCRILLYKDRIYKNEEIGEIQPRLSEVLKANESYWQVEILGASELSTGNIIGSSGDAGRIFGLSGYPGLLILPAGDNASRGVTITVQPFNKTKDVIKIHFPLNITFEFKQRHYRDSYDYPPWSLENLSSAVERLQAFKIEPKPWRWEATLSGKYAGIAWFTQSGRYYQYKIYPQVEWEDRGYSRLSVHVRCRSGGWVPFRYP